MDCDGQRLMDVINDPNALESFLDGIGNGNGNNNAVNVHSSGLLDSTTTAITQQQLANLQQQIQQQQQQLQMLQQQQQQQQIHSPFSVPVRSPAPGTSPAATVILRSPAAPPPAASPSSLASSPAPNTLGHATSYSVSSPAPAPSPGPQQFYRAAPSPQQRSGSLSSTPVASPINYPPGPGPGNGQNSQSVQLPAGTITIPALASKSSKIMSSHQRQFVINCKKICLSCCWSSPATSFGWSGASNIVRSTRLCSPGCWSKCNVSRSEAFRHCCPVQTAAVEAQTSQQLQSWPSSTKSIRQVSFSIKMLFVIQHHFLFSIF